MVYDAGGNTFIFIAKNLNGREKKSLWVNKTTENNVFTIHSMNLNLWCFTFQRFVSFEYFGFSARIWNVEHGFKMIVAIKHRYRLKGNKALLFWMNEWIKGNEPQLHAIVLCKNCVWWINIDSMGYRLDGVNNDNIWFSIWFWPYAIPNWIAKFRRATESVVSGKSTSCKLILD